ncbi:hypothetical protein [Spiroplasma endosymbiont of Othius punctulatus]|uniref:hypothetical protein n=1 Tax=Spiroplasma endosymbiont of Othius punctulatus TaxID=3066289 RepID=UPI0030CB7398
MILLDKLASEVEHLVELNNKFPGVIQEEKIQRILDGWNNIKANPEKHDNTSSVDIFKRDLKGCISILEENLTPHQPHQSMDGGINMNNLSARLARLNPNAQRAHQPIPQVNNTVVTNGGKLRENDREIFIAEDLRAKIELELKSLVAEDSSETQLLKEKTITIKALDMLIANLKATR